MSRTATVTRKTRETNITVTLDLDGSGKADLHTGIGFFDHMLDGFARHGLFDLTLHCDGDLNVDCHHTIEDCGIALGTAIREALGDKAGIVRYGSCMLPMDETLALCAVDLGGRPYFVYDASFAGQSCGGRPTGCCISDVRRPGGKNVPERKTAAIRHEPDGCCRVLWVSQARRVSSRARMSFMSLPFSGISLSSLGSHRLARSSER